jgi:hypothetical protein
MKNVALWARHFTSMIFGLTAFSCCFTPQTHTCLADMGCFSPPATVDCSSADRVYELEDVLSSGSALMGKQIYVRGPLTRGIYYCTLRRCGRRRCCNSCSGWLMLQVPPGCEVPAGCGECLCVESVAYTLFLEGLECYGDDSMKCCPFEPDGRTVIVRGTLKRKPGASSFYHLTDSAMCAAGR